jgi:hypothetical protein
MEPTCILLPVVKPSELEVLHWRARVELGGGVFRGIQAGDAEIGLSPLILFDDADAPLPQRSTMCLKPCDVSAYAVRKAILEKRREYARFQQFAEKACTRVFRQFSQPPLSAKRAVASAALLLLLAGCTFGQPKVRGRFPHNHVIKQTVATSHHPQVAGRKFFGKVWSR